MYGATYKVPTIPVVLGQVLTSPSLQYLRGALTPFVHALIDEYSEEECEVDPMKLPASVPLTQNQANLTALVTRAWGDILKSFNKFPTYVSCAVCLVL